jgi:hypothetical protein
MKSRNELSDFEKNSLFNDHYAEICSSIHGLLAPLPEFRAVKEVPFDNGLYFWFEQGELCSHFQNVARIVRVGNHPNAENGLKNRLRNHYSGGKNGSVFRKFIGGALLRSRDASDPCLEPGPGHGHWEKQDAKPCERCETLEKEVSAILKDRFFFKCVRIDNREVRNYLERATIRDLSRCPNCRPSDTWLGKFAYNPKVRNSGMWNSEFAFGALAAVDGYLDVLSSLVDQTLLLLSTPSHETVRE